MSIDHDVRAEQRYAFLSQIGISESQVAFLAKDMSPRQYFRITDKPYVLMDVPAPDTIHSYVKVAQFLNMHNLRAPQIYQFDEEQGFALIEDFGNETYARVITTDNKRAFELYGIAIDVIKHLEFNAHDKPDNIEVYSIEKLMAETSLFMDWYWLYFFGSHATEKVRDEFYGLFLKHYKSIPKTPSTLVLRDYHLDNLMLIDGQSIQSCGLLDFQDAQWGSVLYDYISLVEDARYDVSEDVAQHCWQKITMNISQTECEYYAYTARILGLGRHLKVLGVFARYALLHKNPSKLTHIDRLWEYIFKICMDLEFKELSIWFKNYFSGVFKAR